MIKGNWRSPSGKYSVRLVHLDAGFRYWAFERHTGFDKEVGLSDDGYGTMDEARAAVSKIEGAQS